MFRRTIKLSDKTSLASSLLYTLMIMCSQDHQEGIIESKMASSFLYTPHDNMKPEPPGRVYTIKDREISVRGYCWLPAIGVKRASFSPLVPPVVRCEDERVYSTAVLGL